MTTGMLFVLFCFVYYGNSMQSVANNMRKMEEGKIKNNKLMNFCNTNPSVCNKYYQPMTSLIQKDNKQNNNENEIFELHEVDENLDLDQQLNLDMKEFEHRKINSEQNGETYFNSNENLYSEQELLYDINRLRASEVENERLSEDARLLKEDSESDNNNEENLGNDLGMWENVHEIDDNDKTPKIIIQQKNLQSDQKNFLKYIDEMEHEAFLIGKKELQDDMKKNLNLYRGFTKHYERSSKLGKKESEWQPFDILKEGSSVQYVNKRPEGSSVQYVNKSPVLSHHMLHQQHKKKHQLKKQYQQKQQQYQYSEKRQQLQHQLKRQNTNNHQHQKIQHSVKQLRPNDMQQLEQQQHSGKQRQQYSREQQQNDMHLFHYKMMGHSLPSPSIIFTKAHKVNKANIGSIHASDGRNNLRQYAWDRISRRNANPHASNADPHASKHNVKLVHGRFKSFPSVAIHNVHRVHSHRKHHLPNVSILYLKKHR